MLPTTITSEVTKLKEKVRSLEVKTRRKNKRALFTIFLFIEVTHESQKEALRAGITHLRRFTSTEVSSSAEPESSVSFLSPRGPFRRSPLYNSPFYTSPTTKHEDTPVRMCFMQSHMLLGILKRLLLWHDYM